ncbi:filamentous hemagglutinin [Photorhabdus luminescens]|nr:filamentous hemagglutinin [Photorhabdus luminescens]
MNKQCYCLIYSRTHGELRVVSELARGCNTTAGQRCGVSRLWVTVRRAVWLLGMALFTGQASAGGIMADEQAAHARRPEVIVTQNGLPQVNINAPNRAGISHNPYKQFDVDQRGAILNNSAVMTSTQLAGMIQGNPRLDPNAAPAQIIINEVNSSNPSQLRGFLEVAGGRAQVIVANPSGIVCNGCGTINAGRMTLTTGKPQLNADGSLAGYQVERGLVHIGSGGLNGDPRHDTKYVDILARAVAVNAGVWAKEELSVVAGRNRISADGKTVMPLGADGKAPELAIDMGQMGGMYSGHIRMIGTDAGVGVRNHGGHLQAGKTLIVSSEGRLSWQSEAVEAVTQASGDVTLTARDGIEHHGKLHSGGQLVVQSREGDIRQSGTLAAAGDIQLASDRGIQSSGHLLAGSDVNSTLTRKADLTLSSQGNIQARGSLLSKSDVSVTGHRVDVSQSNLAASRVVITAQAGGVALQQAKVDSRQLTVNTSGNIEAQQAQVRAGRWAVDADSLFTQGAVWSQVDAGESRFALTGVLDNTEGSIETRQLSLNAATLNNRQGRLVALDGTAQHWRVSGLLDNRDGGVVGSNGNLFLETGHLNNQHGTLQSQSALSITAAADIDNGKGKMLAGQQLILNAAGSVDNQSGDVSGEYLHLTAQSLNNTQGKVVSQGRLQLDTRQAIDNQRGTLQSQSALSITSGADINNGQGKLLAGQQLTLNVTGSVDNQSGEMRGENLKLTAQNLNNTQGKVISQGRLQLAAHQEIDNQQGLVEAGDVLDIRTDGSWNNRRGIAQGSKQVVVSVHGIDNTDGKLQSGGDLTLDSTGDVINQAGTLTAQQHLNWQGGTDSLLNNDGGKLFSRGAMSLKGWQLTNRQKGVVQSQQKLTLNTTGSIDNQSGEMSGENLKLTVQSLNNAQGKVISQGRLQLTAHQSIDNQQGFVEAGNALDIRADGIWGNRGGIAQGGKQVVVSVHGIDNTGGKLQSGGDLTLSSTENVINQAGTLTAQQHLNWQGGTDSLLNNDEGKLFSRGAMSLKGGQLTNRQKGFIQSQQKLTLNATGSIDNQSGEMSGENLYLTAQSLNNTQGKMVSRGRLQLGTHQEIDNQQGFVEAGDMLDVRADGSWNNHGGIAQGGKQVVVSVHSINNTDGKLQSGGYLTLNSTGDVINQAGTLTAQQHLNWQGGTDSLLNNDAGKLFSRSAMSLQGGQLTNRQKGFIQSQKELTLNATGSVDNQSGEMSGENLNLMVQSLNNTQGKVISQGRLQLAAHQSIDNQQGFVEAGDALDIRTNSSWNNRGGIAQGGKQVVVSVHDIDNTDGKLQSGGGLTLNSTGDVINQAGTLTAQQHFNWQGGIDSQLNNDGGKLFSRDAMSLQGGQLTNRQKGFIQSLQELTLNLTGNWDNQGGKLASSGSSTVNAQSLLNAQGEIQVLDTLDMQFTRALNNSNGRIFSKLKQSLRAEDILNAQGWIGSQGSWFATGSWFDNREGNVLSQQETTLAVSELNNQKGILQSASALVLRVAQDIDNRVGKISAQGRLDVQGIKEGTAVGRLQNAGGKLQADDGLVVTAQGVDNQNGLLYSQKQMQLTLNDTLDNRQGKLKSGGDMQLDAQLLLNEMGSMDSQQQLGLRILGLLDNTRGMVRGNGDQQISAERVDNRQGVFSSRGALELAASRLDNPDGMIISQGAGTYRINVLNNQHGKVHSNNTLTLSGEQLNNQAGQLISTKAMRLGSKQLNNSGQGKITSQDALVVQADRLNNREGGLLLGTIHTDVTARELNNTAGRLQSAGALTLSHLNVLDNRQGYLLANKILNINVGNTGAPSVLTLFNQGGTVQSGEQLVVNAHTLNNQGGTLLSQQALTLAVQQDYTHRIGDTLSSNGAMTFSIAGVLTNQADWLLPGNLIVNSTHFTNLGALVGKTLQLTTGTLRNLGRLEADSMMLTSDILDNPATVMGDDITVRSRVIDNYGRDAVIAATESLNLHVGERLTNRDGSLIYSSGTLHLGSDGRIENRASRIEADGDVWVEAKRLDNLREGLDITREAEKSDYKWHRYNYNWRSYGSKVNPDKNTMTPTTQRLTFRDDAAAENSRYGTLLAIDATGKRAQVLVKDSWGEMRELWVNYLALTPGSDGGYDMTFYETRGFRQRAVPTPYHNTVWREHNRGRIEQWDPEKHVDIADAPFVTDYNNFRERSTTGTVTRDKLVSAGTGAHILAGGNMVLRIFDQLLNDASTLSANGDLSMKGDGKVTNRGYSVNERYQEYIVDHYDRDTRHWYPTFNRDETKALTTIDGIITGHGNVTINGAHLENITVNQAQISSVDAAQKAAEAERAEWERNPLAVTVDGEDWQTGDTKLTPSSRPLTPDILPLTPGSQPLTPDIQPLTPGSRPLTPDIQPITPSSQPLTPNNRPLTPAELALTNKQHLGSVATFVPNNGLFRQHPAEGSPYLVVTDERFTSRNRFISSDYLLQQVGYDPVQAHKRLGDGFYEQRLVREQVLKLTGRPSVHGEDAMEQYQSLMNNGVKVAKDFHLKPGVALTPTQIAALQQDIIWLVSETVETATGPQTVWVPKVYLANTTLRLTGDGALIGGGNLQLSANSLNNAGNLFADKALNIDAGQVLHQGGDIRADSVNVQADTLTLSTNLQDALRQATISARELSLSGGDIRLQGAKLGATQNLGLHARNNLDITAARSTATADLEVISGAMGNRSSSGMEDPGKRMAQVSGEWQQALGSTLNAGGDLSLAAGQDITLQGSQAKAGGTTRLQAGGDVKLLAETTTNRTQLEANSSTSSVSNRREEDRLHLSTLSGDKAVTIRVGENLVAEGAQVDSQSGSIGLSAQGVTIKDASQRITDKDSERKREGSTKSQREMETISDSAMGSTFSGRDGITVVAREENITVTGSTLHSEQGALALRAKKDITLNSTTERDYQFSEERSEKKGFLSKSSSHTVQEDSVTREKGTLLSGDSISITAGNDLAVSGSAIAGDKDVTLQAGNNVDITAATETQSHYLLEEKKKSGLLSSGGIGFTVGSQSTRHQINEDGTTQSQSVSAVGSSQGNVSITAGNRAHIGGADLVAGKDLSITGDSVQIDPGYDKRTRTETFESKQSGLTVALSGTVGSALNTAVSTAQQARKESDGRLKALQSTKAALSGAQGYQAWQLSQAESAKADAINQAGGKADKPNDTIGIQLSYGSQSSKSETRTEQAQSQGSSLSAGQDIRIKATGGSSDIENSGNIQVTGSSLKAGRDIEIDAKRDVVLESAENTQTTRGKNSSKGGSVGVGLTAGQGGYGIKFSASVNAGKGHEKGDGVTHTETLVDAGNQVTLKSGQDTTLKGAQISGDKVTADVGHSLHLQSEQDKDNYDSKQENVSAGAGFTYGSMNGSASVNASRDKIHSKFDSVKEQTGIFAGQGGFDVKVSEHTQLDGAVIASTADKDKNRLETGTLGFSNIENKAEYKTEHQSVGVSTGGAIGSQLASNMTSNMLAGTNRSDSQSSTTHAAVEDGTIIVRDKDRQKQDVAELSRDTKNAANGLTPIFDKEKEQRRLAQAQAIAEIGVQVMDIYNTHEAIKATKTATEKLKDPQTQLKLKQDAEEQLKKEGKVIDAKSLADRAYKIAYDGAIKDQGADIGSSKRQAVTAVVGALQGLAGGDIKAAIATGAAPYLANAVKDLTYNGKKHYDELTAEEKATNLAAHAILGGVIAEMKGGSATAGAVGAAGGELAASAIASVLYPNKKPGELAPDEKEKVSNLATLAGGLAAGLATDSTAGGVAGAQAGKNAIENNALSLPKGMAEYGRAQSSLAMQMLREGATPDELSEALAKQARGTHPEGQDPARGLIVAWGNFFGVPLDVVMSNEKMTPEKAAEIVASGIPTSEAKVMQYVAAKAFLSLAKNPGVGSKAGNTLPQWSAGEGKFSPKDQSKVTNVENPTSKPDAKSLPYKDTVGSVGKSTDYVDILSPEAKKHILYGDSPTSGGHIFPGNPGKTTFPSNWTKEKIVHEIGDIATSPKTQWYAQSGTGGLYTKSGKPARWVAWEVRDGVRMRVIYEPANGKVVTAFPDNVSKPAATLKPIK